MNREEDQRRFMRNAALFFYLMWDNTPPSADDKDGLAYLSALVEDFVRALDVFPGNSYFFDLMDRAFLKLEQKHVPNSGPTPAADS